MWNVTERTNAAGVVEITQHVQPMRQGDLWTVRALVTPDASVAADACIFGMRINPLANRRAYLEEISGTIIFSGTVAAGQEQGVYFERFSGGDPSGGTSVLAALNNAHQATEPSIVSVAMHKATALTMTGVNYSGFKFGDQLLDCARGGQKDIFKAFMPPCPELRAGDGLAMRLAYESIAGLILGVTFQWREY